MADGLYLGKSVVHLLPIEGKFIHFEPGRTVVEVPSVPRTQKALKRLQDCSDLGPDYVHVFQPALPSADLLLRPDPPTESPVPLSVKSTKETDLTAIRSGKRSAILRRNGKLYRLKGCGNVTEGFIVQPMAFPEDGKELRGCCFEHTVVRELFMSQVIKEALQGHGYLVGNEPLGYWLYESDPSNTVSFDLPLIGKYCGVYETLGEKRLGSHLLGGLDVLISKLAVHFDQGAIEAFFPASRLKDGVLTQARSLLSTSGPLDSGPFLDEFTRAGVYKNNDSFLDLLQKDLSSAIVTSDFPLDWVPDEIKARLEPSCSQVLPLITMALQVAWIAGREAGQVKRILQDHEISWGYYIDHNPFEPHCNAHPNNFLILNEGHDHITAPVDFDMAFTFRGFMNNLEEPKGVHDYTLFQSFLNSERGALEEALTGVENMANFQYSGTQKGSSALGIAMRDLVLLGYREGFENVADRHPEEVRGNRRVWSAVELCLACSLDYIDY